ncbi:hypothetical protein GCM10023203_38030 [Actinomycetospora straminea]|uniref:Uncharacterized protein n=1 Tax=Actinomycetospora straminea TaxID=663607 RepID=A0ABP9ESS0_9PSEU
MTHEKGGGPDQFDALREAVNAAADPPGLLDWDRVLRAAWFGVDPDPGAPAPRDVVDRAPPRRPDDQDSG